MSFFDLSREEVLSFQNGFYRFTDIDGPIRLARFSDSGRGEGGKYGRFWFYGTELTEILSRGPSGRAIVKEVSKRWAVCDDWGDKGLMWIMNVPKGHSVPAAWGAAKFQPKVSGAAQDAGGRQTTHSYQGESLQLIIPVSDSDRQVNSWLVSLITGPAPTAKVATAPQRFI